MIQIFTSGCDQKEQTNFCKRYCDNISTIDVINRSAVMALLKSDQLIIAKKK